MPPSREGYLWTPTGDTTGLNTDAVVSGTPDSLIRDKYDVIVVGTGFSGLIAARNLSRNPNLSVLLLEGRDRIGGRTWTAKALGEELEMGGTWVHWNQPHKDLFDAMVSSFGSAPGSECGFTEALRWYALGGHTMDGVFELAGVYKLGKGGMSSLARAILDEYHGNLLFNTVLEKVEQSSTSVTLTAKNGKKIRASQVISTIPLNCLSDISFTPSLSPLRQEAIRAGHINQDAKIHFKLGLTEPGWFSMASGYGNSPWCFSFSDHNGTAKKEGTYCIGFGYNGHLTDPRASSHIISTFKQYLKPNADVKAYLTHDWMNDNLAKGAWSCWGPNAMSRWLKELQKSDGRLHFANADWADGWRGFIDGAIERGVVASREVEQLLREERVKSKI
ncbi:hypothetical protein N0V84_011232 [Fusarium piperis]|uniref:monoamine oxidase n=1 Tax=Fusarium piperis TaxID=1435070 RepID=A0A9W8TCK1_9HYPO|nr:hypothetical protein N0V84_011232 [Fusarium piperis]